MLPIDALHCPKCAYNVFGLSERRCPECGDTFDWRKVLDVARAQTSRQFEQNWWGNPLPALLRTWRLAALQPRKLWSEFDFHDRPQLTPLCLLLLLQGFLFAKSWEWFGPLAEFIMNGFESQVRTRTRFIYQFRFSPEFMQCILIGWFATLVTLLLFIQTNRRFNLSWRKIFRAYVYSTAFASTLFSISLIAEMIADSTILFMPSVNRIPMSVYNGIQGTILLLAIPVTFAHLSIAYTKYLKVPHGWVTAALSIVLGTTVALSTTVALYLMKIAPLL